MTELPRLLFCCFDVVPAPHATSRRLTEYLETLGDRYQVVALTVKTPDHSHIERYRGARLLRVPVGNGDLRSRMEAFDRAVRRQLESEEYLLVHFFDPVSGYPLCERRSDFGYRLVYDACRFPSGDLPSLMPTEGSNKRLLARSRRQELFCLLNADAVIVGSEGAKAHAVSLGVPADHLEVLRAPVELGVFSPEVMGAPSGTPARLIHLGSHGRHQDLPVLLEALARSSSGAKLALVGPAFAELTGPLKARAMELGLGERVEFQDPVAHPDLHKVLAAADIGLVTLTDDLRNRTTTALARISEYLAAGRPIIAADLPSTRELLPAAATRFYPPGDVAALAAAIDELASNPALRIELGAAARAAATTIDSKAIRDQLIALYGRVAPASQGGRRAESAAEAEPGSHDATMLGGQPPPDEAGDVTQAGIALAPAPADVGTNKVKTDPAVVAPAGDSDTGTDRAAARDRPPVMGVLVRESVESTDPALQAQREPPVVMGSPLPDSALPKEVPTDPSLTKPPLSSEPSPVPRPTAPNLPPVLTQQTMALPTDDEPLDFGAVIKPSAPRPPPPAITERRPPVPAVAVPTSYSLPGKEALVSTAAPPSSKATASTKSSVSGISPAHSPSSSPSGAGLAPQATAPSSASGGSPPPLSKSAPSSPSGATAGPRTSTSTAPIPASSPSGAPVVSPPSAATARTSTSSAATPASSPDGAPVVSSPSGATAAPRTSTSSATIPASSPSGATTAPRTSTNSATIPASSPSGATTAPRTSTSSASPPPLPAPAVSRTSGVQTAGSAAPAAEPAKPAPKPERRSSGSKVTRVPLTTPPKGKLPAEPTPTTPSGAKLEPSEGLPPLSRLLPNPDPTGARAILTRQPEDHEVPHVDDVELVNDESFQSLVEEDEPDSELDSGELHALETSAAPPDSRLDPWFAQLVHGYCPPESQLFTRHVPPTTMPGRDR